MNGNPSTPGSSPWGHLAYQGVLRALAERWPDSEFRAADVAAAIVDPATPAEFELAKAVPVAVHDAAASGDRHPLQRMLRYLALHPSPSDGVMRLVAGALRNGTTVYRAGTAPDLKAGTRDVITQRRSARDAAPAQRRPDPTSRLAVYQARYGRSYNPRDPIPDAAWHWWQRASPLLAATFGTRPFTAAEAILAGAVFETFWRAEQIDPMLRRVVGVSEQRVMVVPAARPGYWRLIFAATDRPSAAWDAHMAEQHPDGFGWPELWASRHLTPFADLDPVSFAAAWSGWARVGTDCTCGRFAAAHVEVVDAADGWWRIGPAACRSYSPPEQAFIDAIFQRIGWGVQFASRDLIANSIDALSIGASGRDDRSVTAAVARLADRQPPGESGWFLIRCGLIGGRRTLTSFALTSFGWHRRLESDEAGYIAD